MNKPLSEQQIRQIIRQEIQSDASSSRYQLTPTNQHAHTGIDSPRISQNDIIPNGCVSGTVTFAHTGDYVLNLNGQFTPSRIDTHGNITGASSEKAVSIGLAILTPSFPFEPNTTSSVVTGNFQSPSGTPEYPNGNVPMQTSVYFLMTVGGVAHTLVGDSHITNVEYPTGTIFARATVTGFSRKAINVHVSHLTTGWEMNINYTIT